MINIKATENGYSTLKTLSTGSLIPGDLHSVSVSLPTWSANVGYEENDKQVMDLLQGGKLGVKLMLFDIIYGFHLTYS